MYRIRTADKGRPIIISNRVIEEYAEPLVDTLHKKDLFSLGEDRYLTTLLLKHFPTFRTKFTPDAVAHTIAPESWRVLFSQRRRWINSTVHNLCELVFLPELFGFCCFSMRFFVFVDLLGTLILPSTVVYVSNTWLLPLPMHGLTALCSSSTSLSSSRSARPPFHSFQSSCWRRCTVYRSAKASTNCRLLSDSSLGYYLLAQARVHAHWMDGRLPPFVRHRCIIALGLI